ncbi:MAG: sensor histidine kinase N-terminal domain-containing protein, partial [Pseudomonadota bacterium]
MAASLRGHLLRMLLPPVAALLALGAASAYFLSLGPGSDAYDQALGDFGLALGERIRAADGAISFDLPRAAERLLRTDKYDKVYYQVLGPDGAPLAGDAGLPPVPPSRRLEEGAAAYDDVYLGSEIRVVAQLVPCGSGTCIVQVAETTNKRRHLARGIVLSSVAPALLIALLALAIVWFGVKRGLAPLEDLSADIRARS